MKGSGCTGLFLFTDQATETLGNRVLERPDNCIVMVALVLPLEQCSARKYNR